MTLAESLALALFSAALAPLDEAYHVASFGCRADEAMRVRALATDQCRWRDDVRRTIMERAR